MIALFRSAGRRAARGPLPRLPGSHTETLEQTRMLAAEVPSEFGLHHFRGRG